MLTELREYAEMSHCSLDSGMSRSLPMVGSEIDTAVMFEVWRCHLYMHAWTMRVNEKEELTFKIIARVTVPISRKSFALDRLGCVAGSSFWMEVMEPASLSLVTARSFSVGEGSGCC